MKQFLFFIAMVCAGISLPAQSHSVLSQGNWVKVATDTNAIYRLTFNDLQEMGVDVSNLSSDHLNLYGYPAGSLNKAHASGSTYDLQKMAILVDDGGDGTFDAGDFLLFYGQSAVSWQSAADSSMFNHSTNPYCNKVYYYLRTDDTDPKRVKTLDFSSQTPTDTITSLTYTYLHEKELYNPLHSGLTWMGELFSDTTERTFTVDLPGYLVKGGKMYLKIGAGGTERSYFTIYVNGQAVDSIYTIAITHPVIDIYRTQYDTIDLPDLDNHSEIKFVYNKPNDSAFAYLDYFELNLNTMTNIPDPVKTTEIRSTQAFEQGTHLYRFTNTQSFNFVWDITDPLEVSSMKIDRSGDTLSFIDNRSGRNYMLYNYAPGYYVNDHTGLLRKKIYLVGDNNLPTPELIGRIDNQDIIGTPTPNMIIITTETLQDAAKKLAQLHTDKDNLKVDIFLTNQIYNEFSGGRTDPSAIHNLIVQKHNQASKKSKLQYILLLGQASFDYRGIEYPEIEQVPTYETKNSFSMINSYATDTYLATINDTILPIGRIPARTADEAEAVVNKIIDYQTGSDLTTWKNSAIMVADNSVYGVFMQDSDAISDSILSYDYNLNQSKLYLSLFPDVNGEYPQVKQKLINRVNDGVFYVNYTGQGGPNQLATEDIFSIEDAKALENTNRYPLWVNASGGTAKFDDPEQQSVNAALVMNSLGGAIAAIGNSAPNYNSVNFALNSNMMTYLFDKNNKQRTIGDAYAYAVNNNISSQRAIWTLLGDPALKPAWPDYGVETTKVNGEDISSFNDTILPGSLLTLEGNIVDNGGNIVTDFTGKVRATVYDMPYTKETIEGENDPVKEITLYDSLLAMNCIDVKNGHFIGNVRLPALEHLTYGNIKISYYGQNGTFDATDNLNTLVYGGKPNGIGKNPAFEAIRAYPSPFTNHLQLQFPGNFVRQNLTIKMVDVTGRAVYQNQINANSTSGKISLNMPDLPQGIYFLNITGNKGAKAFKLVHQ